MIDTIRKLKNDWIEKYGNEPKTVCMNKNTYNKLQYNRGTIFGMNIAINTRLNDNVFEIRDLMRNELMHRLYEPKGKNMYYGGYTQKPWVVFEVATIPKKLPKDYIINDGATILFWDDGSKTIVKRSKDDNYDKVKGFLWAYFQKTSGLSKTKANKYLARLKDGKEPLATPVN